MSTSEPILRVANLVKHFQVGGGLFGGPAAVGIGVSGTFTETRGDMTGTALVGKASQIFGATLHKLAEAD